MGCNANVEMPPETRTCDDLLPFAGWSLRFEPSVCMSIGPMLWRLGHTMGGLAPAENMTRQAAMRMIGEVEMQSWRSAKAMIVFALLHGPSQCGIAKAGRNPTLTGNGALPPVCPPFSHVLYCKSLAEYRHPLPHDDAVWGSSSSN
jgi:hypothetical protein